MLQQVAGAVRVVAGFQPGGRIVERRGVASQIGLLRQVADRGTGLQEAAATVGLDLAGSDLEQGGLAGAVASDERDLVAGGDRELGILEQERRAESQTDILESEDRSGGHPVADMPQLAGGVHGRADMAECGSMPRPSTSRASPRT